MKYLLLLLIVNSCLLTACNNNQEKEVSLKRIVFDPGHLQFIASSVNLQHQTMSALYGNTEASRSLSQQDTSLGAHSELKLVTWRLHDNPQYFGGKINGELLYIETVSADKKNGLSYSKQSITKSSKLGLTVNNRERIAYIMGYQPVSFP